MAAINLAGVRGEPCGALRHKVHHVIDTVNRLPSARPWCRVPSLAGVRDSYLVRSFQIDLET